MSERLLVLVRHGQSEWNLKNLFTGWKDPDLTELGVKEAREARLPAGSDHEEADDAREAELVEGSEENEKGGAERDDAAANAVDLTERIVGFDLANDLLSDELQEHQCVAAAATTIGNGPSTDSARSAP